MAHESTLQSQDAHSPKKTYRTLPVKTSGMPDSIPYIIGNEFAERFSFYGMRAILIIFMTDYLMNQSGALDTMSNEEAKSYFHLFVSAVYFTPLIGAVIADGFLGKYRTIIYVSIIYCFGHLALALDNTRLGLAIGLTLIAFGSGGIKPCVSANVGDQFGQANKHLIEKVFEWFYFSINVGSALSTVIIPWTLQHYGPHVAFGIPGILMFIATVIFWMGRYKFVHIPPGGLAFVKETFSGEGMKTAGKLIVIYLFVTMFWSLFDQTASAWVLQAKHMDLRLFGFDFLPSQIHAANPIFVILFIPLFSKIVYPAVSRVFPLTPLRKISIGFFVAIPSFLIPAWLEVQIINGFQPSVIWQLLAYAFITAAEVMISITVLEFSYTQAPNKMKSFIMALNMAAIGTGNLFTSLVNFFIQNEDGSSKLAGANYYLFFSALIAVTAVVFIFVAYSYKGKTHVQDEAV
ncbi:MAG: MFS transporter [Candidatus Omnitrophota bacterium]|jgi:POT family proton-dependent oligopeptide transporter|nr:MAG: MFS transporter [Candidatus Omnitrophota bacterium]